MHTRPSCRWKCSAPSTNGRAGQGCSESTMPLRLSSRAGGGENSQVAVGRTGLRRNPLEPRSPSEADNEVRDGAVQSVDRALSILETLSEDDEGYRLSDLAVRTGLSTSTVHRLLATLESRRFVQFDRTESKWHVGARAFTVGATFARRRNFSAQAVPYLRKLRDLTRETANLAVVDDEFIIVLTRMESREIMRSLTKVGGRVAMVASG